MVESLDGDNASLSVKLKFILPTSVAINMFHFHISLKILESMERRTRMHESRSPAGGYILAAVLGATAGGIAVAFLTKAIPVMMSRMMSSMMGNMMTRVGGEGCDPEEM
jgi:hypothetical protein